MLKHIFAIFVLSFQFAIANGQSLQNKQRDLDDYEKIIVSVPGFMSPYPAIARVRNFIWEHWEKRTLGYAEISLRTKEGEPITSYYFIEPDTAGAWRVVVRMESEYYERGAVNAPQRTNEITRRTQTYEAYAVEQVSLPEGKRARGVKNQNNSYLLRFKDKNGNVLFQE